MLLEPIRCRGTRLYELVCEHDSHSCGRMNSPLVMVFWL
jgi:hypothetical protein